MSKHEVVQRTGGPIGSHYTAASPVPLGTVVMRDEDQTPRCKCPKVYYIVVETGERIHMAPWCLDPPTEDELRRRANGANI